MDKLKSRILFVTIAVCIGFVIVNKANAYDIVDETGAATEEALRDTTCAFYVQSANYTNETETMVGSGVIIKHSSESGTRFYILTAKHVATVLMTQIEVKSFKIAIKLEGYEDVVKRIPYNIEKIRWIATEDMRDLALFDISNEINGFEDQGCLVKAIDIDKCGVVTMATNSRCLVGTGVADRSHQSGLRINDNSPVLVVLGDPEKNIAIDDSGCNYKTSFECKPLALKKLWVAIQYRGYTFVNHIIGLNAVEGNSGSPVFACGFINGVAYPMLLGLVVSNPVTGITGVEPIDSVYDYIKDNKTFIRTPDPVGK